MTALQELQNRIHTNTATIGIYGLGYVGLPLALRFSEVGVKVIGFDIDPNKVTKLNQGQSYIERITPAQIQTAQQQGFVATTDSQKLDTGKVRGTIVLRLPPRNLDALVLKLRAPCFSFVQATMATSSLSCPSRFTICLPMARGWASKTLTLL